MIRAILISVVPALLLSACAEDGLADQLARKQAKQAVNTVLADKAPGVSVEPATDCVIDNASASEILTLAGAGLTGPDAKDAELVLDIASRPDTLKCLLSSGIAPFVI